MPDLKWNDLWNKEAERYLKGEGPAKDKKMYGYHWGDPIDGGYSGVVLKRDFIDPYVSSDVDIIEVGCGGGRFTQYLTDARTLHLVEYNEKMFDIIRYEFPAKTLNKITFIHSQGSDFNGVKSESMDRVFTFDVFVHLELDLIEGYISEMKRVLKPGGYAIIHYADASKELARKNISVGMFVEMYPEDMHKLVKKHGFSIVKEDTQSISHSAVIVVQK